jgi:hypothetical protein
MDSKDLLTRSQAAKILQVSVSTVRRLETRQLEVEVIDGVHYFHPDHVQALAANLERSPSRSTRANLSPGELAREVFRRFEQGQGLSEIVQALALDPKRVRDLYHEWRTPLELSELLAGTDDPQRATPARDPKPRVRILTVDNPEVLLDALPAGQPTRLSVATYSTEWCSGADDAAIYHEQGGFVTYGPVTLEALRERLGPGRHRLTAYDLAAEARLWECYINLAQPTQSAQSAAQVPFTITGAPSIAREQARPAKKTAAKRKPPRKPPR